MEFKEILDYKVQMEHKAFKVFKEFLFGTIVENLQIQIIY